MRKDERQRWRNLLRCGGDESSRWNKRCLQARSHSNVQVSNETEKECVNRDPCTHYYSFRNIDGQTKGQTSELQGKILPSLVLSKVCFSIVLL